MLLQSGHTVWVSLRSRLLKCNSDQLRSASQEESIGAELHRAGELKDLVQQTSTHRAGAIDVSQDGTRPRDEVIPTEAVPNSGLQDISLSPQGPTAEASTTSSERLPSIPEDRTPDAIGVGQPLRDIETFRPLPDASPQTPVFPRQTSQQTQEEPFVEPFPSSARSSGSAPREMKKARSDPSTNRRKRSGLTEIQELERVAAREIRRLDREERSAARSSLPARALPSSQAAPAATTSAEVIDMEEEEVPETPFPDEDDQSDLWTQELGNFFCFAASDDGLSLLAKPAKSKNRRVRHEVGFC